MIGPEDPGRRSRVYYTEWVNVKHKIDYSRELLYNYTNNIYAYYILTA